MCHQPFENWIIEQSALTPQERRQLEEHLETCPQCKRLQSNMQAVNVRLFSARQANPSPGFSTRWQTTLQNRLEEKRMKEILQIRRFFLFLGTATFVSLILLVLFAIVGGGAVNLLGTTLERLSTATQWLQTLQGYLFALLQITPPVVPLILWISITTVFSILALIWVVSLWRITFQGVKSR